ncbi:MAG: lipopolysaccharide biosynthesis protein [Capsulimonadaceae bacterium]
MGNAGQGHARNPDGNPDVVRPPNPVAALCRRIGIDRAVGFTVLARGWQAVSGLVVIVAVAHFLSPSERGYYFTFNSIIALQVVIELGLTFVILQFASHEKSRLQWSSGLLEGDSVAKSRLGSLLRLGIRWYSALAALLLLTVLPAGYIFFTYFGPNAAAHIHVNWLVPWVWLVASSAVTLAMSPIFATLEGCGLVAEVASVRAVQAFVTSILLLAAMSAHGGLFAAPIATTGGVAYAFSWLWTQKRRALADLFHFQGKHTISWRHDVWPFQWRIGLSWLSGYCVYQLFTPVMFAFHGPAAAGRVGLSLSIMMSLANIATSWLNTKSPRFGDLVARREFNALDRLFFPCLWQSFAVLVVSGLAYWSGAALLVHLHLTVANKLVGLVPLGLLVAAALGNHIVTAEALYLRAHKQEPFLVLSVLLGVSVGILDCVLCRPFGATGMIAGYLAAVLIVGVCYGTSVFVSKRRQWHATPAADAFDDDVWPPPPVDDLMARPTP